MLRSVDSEYSRLRDEAIEAGVSTSAYINGRFPEPPPLDPAEQLWLDEERQREIDRDQRALDRIMGRTQ